ncbi:hypothetical protein PG996_014815 [Apiospora saccharicola]|uniref:Malic acid transport protein n=1 Tax=Apiospora saccharicola TaxID=335842 RepID=A0ABR1TJC9_9PEZI
MWRRHNDEDDRQNDSDDTKNEELEQVRKVRFLDRLEHFTWANFTFPMSTGGISLLLSEKTQPFNFRGLQTIGKVFYIFDLIVFSFITMCIITRFLRFKGSLKKSIANPTEGLFLGTAQLSLASIIVGMARYGIPECGPWLVVVYRVLFWIYFAVGWLIAVGQYTTLFTSPKLKGADMTPAWDLPIFPFMLSGTIASAGAAHQPPEHAVPMIVAGLTAQGLGMLVSLCMYALYCARMIEYGFPATQSRPGMFIAVGPPSFTALALIGMAKNFPTVQGYWGDAETTVQVLEVLATVTGIFIWSLSFWFWCISTLACLQVWRQLKFSLSWWAFVFPNVGFTIATITIGQSLESTAIEWVGTIMTIGLIITWLFVFVNYIRAILRNSIWVASKDAKDADFSDNHNRELSKMARVAKQFDEEKQS